MTVSYIALSVSFVFLFMAVDEYFKKNHDLMGRFVCVSLVANLISMFSFVFPTPSTAQASEETITKEISEAVTAREETHRRINEDLKSMNEMATDMLVDLGEIKGMLRYYTGVQPLESSLESSLDSADSDTPK